jgi:hypothetical protein
MWRGVALVRKDVSEERTASIIRVKKMNKLGAMSVVITSSVLQLIVTANAVPSSPILVTLIIEAITSSETSVHTTVTRHHIPENGILHSHGRESLKSYTELSRIPTGLEKELLCCRGPTAI